MDPVVVGASGAATLSAPFCLPPGADQAAVVVTAPSDPSRLPPSSEDPMVVATAEVGSNGDGSEVLGSSVMFLDVVVIVILLFLL